MYYCLFNILCSDFKYNDDVCTGSLTVADPSRLLCSETKLIQANAE